MIIPIAIDLSEHDSIPENAHDSADFATLSKHLYSYPFLLFHDNDSMEHSHFYQMISQLSQKNRDKLNYICKKIPRQAVPDWNGIIELNDQSTLYSAVKIAGISKNKFHRIFNCDNDVFVVPHPAHADVECALWKAIEHTQFFTQIQQLTSADIKADSLRSTLWKERFATIIAANKWKRIKITDRYIFVNNGNLNFTAIDFMLSELDKQLTHATELEIFVQTNTYKGTKNDQAFDHFPAIVSHLQQSIESFERIAALRVYAYSSRIGSTILHDRFMHLHSTHELLYTYNVGVGFKVMHNERINEMSTFTLKIHSAPSEHEHYAQIGKLTPSSTTMPNYESDKVAVYIC